MTGLSALVELIEQGAPGGDLAAFPLPESYRAAVVRRDEQAMFEGMAPADKDPRRSLHVDEEWRRLGKDVRALVGEDPHIVFEHPGRQTMGASVFLARKGGTIVTCAATSGYMIEYDNRHLWMKLKTIKASHFANYKEA